MIFLKKNTFRKISEPCDGQQPTPSKFDVRGVVDLFD